MLPIENILFDPIEDKRETTPDEAPQIEEESVQPEEPEVQEEVYPEKPRDENSEKIANTNLTDEEIAQLILDEEEVLNKEKGVLGINFNKLRPRAPLFKESKVFQQLAQEVNAEPAQVQELKRQTTFLQKPARPVPKARTFSQSEELAKSEPEVEPYRVVIKKQPKKSVTLKLLEKGLIDPSRVKSPEPASEVTEPSPPSSPDNDVTVIHFASVPKSESVASDESSFLGSWSYTSSIDDDTDPVSLSSLTTDTEPPLAMLPINESTDEPIYYPAETGYGRSYDEYVPASFVPTIKRPSKPRLCRRGRYAKRCLNRALESLKSPSGKTKPRLLKRAHYFERICSDIKRTVNGEKEPAEDSLLRLLMLASLACSIKDTYDQEILHRGSSRRNSRRMSSCRRESNPGGPNCFESDFLAFKPGKEDSLTSFQSRCAEGRRRLSVMGMVVAEKVNTAMRTDLARGIAYAMVPCATALAFFMFNYAKRYNTAE